MNLIGKLEELHREHQRLKEQKLGYKDRIKGVFKKLRELDYGEEEIMTDEYPDLGGRIRKWFTKEQLVEIVAIEISDVQLEYWRQEFKDQKRRAT